MTGQLESNHFYRTGDRIARADGTRGTVTEGRTLYAIVTWDGGASEEIDQFDPRFTVLERSLND